jgi:hypothetical protein
MTGGEEVEGLAVRECGDVVFAVWTRGAEAWRMRGLSDQIAVAAARNGGSVVLCQFIDAAAKPPDASGRAAGLELLKRHQAALRSFVTVPIGDAIWIGIVGSIMRGFFVLLRRSDMLHISADVPSAIEQVLVARSPRTPPKSILTETATEMLLAAGVDPRVRGRAAS